MQKIEDNILRGDEELTLHSADGHGTEKASSRVRDIVTRSFADNTSANEVGNRQVIILKSYWCLLILPKTLLVG